MHRHAGGDLVQLLKFERPEELIEVEITVVALGRACVGTEKKQFGAIRQDDRVTGQFNADDFAGKCLDVPTKQVRLVFRSRQENLVTPGLQRINERLAGKVVSGADLPAFEDDASALVSRPVPILLVVETPIDKRFAQQLDLVFADVVFRRLFLRPFVALGKVGVEFGFGSAALETLNARLALQLAVQQVNFLEVAAALAFLEDQLHQTRFQRTADPLDIVGPVPLVPSLPAV